MQRRRRPKADPKDIFGGPMDSRERMVPAKGASRPIRQVEPAAQEEPAVRKAPPPWAPKDHQSGEDTVLRLFRDRRALLRSLLAEVGGNAVDPWMAYDEGFEIANHTLRLGSKFRHAPAWISSVILSAKDERDADSIGEGKFLEHLQEAADSRITEDEAVWIFASLARGGKLEFDELRKGMRAGVFSVRNGRKYVDSAAYQVLSPSIKPLSSDMYGTGGPVYSTIHASKGLEADRVELEGWEWDWPARDPDRGMTHNAKVTEARVMYVATTRAKKELHVTKQRNIPYLASKGLRVRGANGKNKNFIQYGKNYLEFGRQLDIDHAPFRGVFKQMQETLAEHPGHPVRCTLDKGWILRSSDGAPLGTASGHYTARPRKGAFPDDGCRFHKGSRGYYRARVRNWRPVWHSGTKGALKSLEGLVWYGNKSCSPPDGPKDPGLKGRWRDAEAYHIPLVYGLGHVTQQGPADPLRGADRLW